MTFLLINVSLKYFTKKWGNLPKNGKNQHKMGKKLTCRIG
jgi:hypothetical protein